MGQYYKAVSIDAKQYISPFGAKLMEHSWVHNSYMKQVERFLSPGGGWHKTRLVWAGDYADEGLFVPDGYEGTLYSYVYDNYTSPSDSTGDGPDIKYIVNHSKNVYIDMEEVPNLPSVDSSWKIHPLSILTSSGNGRGGGDYRDDDDDTIVGSWAGDVISTEFLEPEGMEKYTAFFTED